MNYELKQMAKRLNILLLAFICIVGEALGKTVVWQHPATEVNTLIDGYFRTLLEVTRVELAPDETRLWLHVSYRPENWVRFSSESYLLAGGKRYRLKGCEGIELDKETHLTYHKRTEILLRFDPLPKGTERFDYTEGDGQGAFQVLGIEDAATRADLVFPSCWTDTRSGDWLIGLWDDFAVFQCRFWHYRKREQKGDTFNLVLESEGQEVTVSIGKNRKGCRAITIDGEKSVCRLITGICLPDYPMPDTTTTFRNTHYETDTVTFVGWLKDMPEHLKRKGNEYRVTGQDIFSGEDRMSYGKLDSLGRFQIKVPLQNATEVFMDWERTFIRTLFEPGETYFLLYDFHSGQKLFMGRNSRLQNELLAHPIEWLNAHAGDDMDEAAAMHFAEETEKERQRAMASLQADMDACPTLSSRCVSFLTGSYLTTAGRNLMQGRYRMKDRQTPAAYLQFVGENYWAGLTQPYSLHSDFSTFCRAYTNQLVWDKHAVKGPKYSFIQLDDMQSTVLRRYRDAGMVELTDEELAAIDEYMQEERRQILLVQSAEGDSAREAATRALKECSTSYMDIIAREDVKDILIKETPLFPLYRTLDIADSLGVEGDLRDIIIASELHRQIDEEREPFSDFVMHYIDENIQMPAARAYLHAEQEKYLAISERAKNNTLQDATSLKTAEQLAGMTDGDWLLRKLTEPYRGRYILLDIWGTWCGPCKTALAHSQEEYERLAGFDLVFLYLANNSPQEAWKNVIAQYEVTGENVVHYNLPEDQQSAIEHFVGITGYPTYKLIDPEGNVLDVNADPRNLDRLVHLLEQLNN